MESKQDPKDPKESKDKDKDNDNSNSNSKEVIVSEFTETIIKLVEKLKLEGKSYRRKIYKFNDIINYFIDNMKIKNKNLGDKYINDMVININNIFENVSRQSKYDVLEFVKLVIQYGYKMISYKYTKNKIEPTLPDYTVAEIKEMKQIL